jgi:hypothetical protein
MKNYKSILRDLKLRILDGEEILKIDKNRIRENKKQLQFITKYLKEDDVISGSLCLSLYGIINRSVKDSDIDVLIKDSDRYDDYESFLSYGDNELENRLGFKEFKYRTFFGLVSTNIEVDFFINEGASYEEIEFRGKKIKLQSPIEIISKKIDMWLNIKHYSDLDYIFYKLELNSFS